MKQCVKKVIVTKLKQQDGIYYIACLFVIGMDINMNLFSETYNCYYQIMKEILKDKSSFTLDELRTKISRHGFEESLLYIIPKLSSGEWSLLKKNGELYCTKLSGSFYVPLTTLQKSYLKTILQDKKMQLFLDEPSITNLTTMLKDVPTLWDNDTFYYYDRYSDGDDFTAPAYKKHFRMLLAAIEQKRFVDIDYTSPSQNRVHHHYLPCRLEYSIKNNKFRLLAKTLPLHKGGLETLNLERMTKVEFLDQFAENTVDLNQLIRSSYYKEPVCLHIYNERNALERTMLHFANYEKNTTKIGDNLYECLIYYNKMMETELLIEVLSFGPMLKVLGSEHFLKQIKGRLYRQNRLECLPNHT